VTGHVEEVAASGLRMGHDLET